MHSPIAGGRPGATAIRDPICEGEPGERRGVIAAALIAAAHVNTNLTANRDIHSPIAATAAAAAATATDITAAAATATDITTTAATVTATATAALRVRRRAERHRPQASERIHHIARRAAFDISISCSGRAYGHAHPHARTCRAPWHSRGARAARGGRPSRAPRHLTDYPRPRRRRRRRAPRTRRAMIPSRGRSATTAAPPPTAARIRICI